MKQISMTSHPRRSSAGHSGVLSRLLAAAVLVLILLLAGCRESVPRETTAALLASTEPTAASSAPVTTEAETDLPVSDTPEPDSTAPTEPASTEAPTEPEVESEDWKLILVNADHPLPENYSIQLKQLRNGQRVDERIYPPLQQMFDDARAEGIYPLINESYRTSQRQQQIMDQYVSSFESQGMSRKEAEKKARTIVALPGTSEHELGLALDIIDEYNADSTAVWQWLRENAWRYGFILRYPADKEAITGIDYEPWHYRYVGVPTAREITESGLCLEEYLDRQNQG